MKTWHHIEELGRVATPIHLAIGVFDGVHLGHQALIQSAQKAGGTTVVLTFEPHPMTVLAPERAPQLLTPTPHKLAIFACLDVEHVLLQPFHLDFSRLTGHDFVHLLRRHLPTLASVHVGAGWIFGHQRGGNVALLRELLEPSIAVQAIEPVQVSGETVSSTLVRRALEAGELTRARVFLGRDYSVDGQVVHGQELGRKLGFPTANLATGHLLLPPHGVYAVRVRQGDRLWHGVANLGLCPTVADDPAPRLEVHLFDFAGDLYGQTLEVAFCTFLRAQQKFAGVEELRAQIARDGHAAREALGG